MQGRLIALQCPVVISELAVEKLFVRKRTYFPFYENRLSLPFIRRVAEVSRLITVGVDTLFVFGGQFLKTLTRNGVTGATGKATALRGLFSEMGPPNHQTLAQ
jgi:hypothetical protein